MCQVSNGTEKNQWHNIYVFYLKLAQSTWVTLEFQTAFRCGETERKYLLPCSWLSIRSLSEEKYLPQWQPEQNFKVNNQIKYFCCSLKKTYRSSGFLSLPLPTSKAVRLLCMLDDHSNSPYYRCPVKLTAWWVWTYAGKSVELHKLCRSSISLKKFDVIKCFVNPFIPNSNQTEQS